MKAAIDPGANGGVAFQKNGISAQKLPKNGKQWQALIEQLKECDVIYVENLWSTPHRHHQANWVLSGSFNQIMMAIHLAGKEATLVTPASWQKKLAFSLPKDYNEKKRACATFAKTIYPKATLATADAICMIHVL
jgi:hypothetical protein